MASDWIKLRVDIFRDPSVLRMSDTCRTSRHHIVGLLSDVWGWIDGHTVDGSCPNISTTMIDTYVGVDGFAEAMAAAGWLKVDGDGITLPKWERHNSVTAKARALENEAKRLRRTGVGQVSDKTSDKVSIKRPTREEKRREETNSTPIPQGEVSEFDRFWQAYPKKKNRGDAVKAWAKARKATPAAMIIAAVEKQRTSPDWTKDNGQFIPYPASWLNAEGWLDELAIGIPAANGTPVSRPFNPEEWQ